MQRYDFMSNHVSFSNRFWVSILDNPHRVYRLRQCHTKLASLARMPMDFLNARKLALGYTH
jgi:hypothetical protein